MSDSENKFAWVTIQEEGNEASMSSPTEVWGLHPNRPFHIDALKKAIKQEFSVSLKHIDAAELKVWDCGHLLKPGSLVAEQRRGADDAHPLRVTYSCHNTKTSPLGGKLEAGSDLPKESLKELVTIAVSGAENPTHSHLSKTDSTESAEECRIQELEQTERMLKEERDRLQGRLEAEEKRVKQLTETIEFSRDMGWSHSEPEDSSVPVLALERCQPTLSGKAHRFPQDLAIINEVPCHMLLNDFSEDGNPKRLWASASWLGHIGETLAEYLESQGNMAATASDHLKKKCFELGSEIQGQKRSQSFEWVVQPNNQKPRRLVHMVHPIVVQEEQQPDPKTMMIFVFFNADNSSMDLATVGQPLDFHLEANICQRTHAYPEGLDPLNDIPILSVLYDLREAGRPKQLWANAQWLAYTSQSMEELRQYDLASTLSAPRKELLRKIGCRVHEERKAVSHRHTICPTNADPVRVLAVYRPVLLEGFDCPMALCTYLPPDHGSQEESIAPSVVSQPEHSEQVWNIVELKAVLFDVSGDSGDKGGVPGYKGGGDAGNKGGGHDYKGGGAIWANYAARVEYSLGWDQLGRQLRSAGASLRTCAGHVMDLQVVLESVVWPSETEMLAQCHALQRLPLTAPPVVITRRKKRASCGRAQMEEVWHQLTFSPCKNPYTGANSVLLQESDVSELMRAQRQLEASHEVKDRLLQCVSHELRTPLHGILNLSGALADSSECHPRHRKALCTIEESANRLNNIVNDILETADGMSGNVPLNRACFSLAQLVQAVVEERRELLRRGVQLINLVHPECAVDGDAYRVDRILSHLIENAIKFTTKGSITVSSTVLSAEFVRVDVEDSGCGIPSEQLELIWEHFQQGDMSIEREHGGTGLGLTLVKCLVTAHGGTVAVQSDQRDDGEALTRFSFTLPLWRGDQAHVCTSPRTSKRSGGNRSPLAGLKSSGGGVKRSSVGKRREAVQDRSNFLSGAAE